MCVQCEAIIPAQAMVCSECGYVYQRKVEYDKIKLEFIRVVEAINTKKIIADTNGKNHWQPYFILESVALKLLKNSLQNEEITPSIADRAFDDFEYKIKEWRSLMPKVDFNGNPIILDGVPQFGQPYSKNIRDYAYKSFIEKIKKYNNSLLKKVI